MAGSWRDSLLISLETLNQILSAGIAITAFSLLLYALAFNLRDRVARSFAIILGCVLIVYTGEAIGSTATTQWEINFWLRFQWIGLFFLPPAYLHFSDALLSTTGKPSRGRRRWLVRVTYILSGIGVILIPFSNILGPVVLDQNPAPYLERTIVTEIFTLYYAGSMVLSWFNFFRAYQRTITTTGRRRMAYLLISATAPAMGSYPYLMFGSSLVSNFTLLFWFLSFLSNILVGGLVVVMSYATAFYGVAWPDRVVRRRLFKWIMRGPVTAGIALAATTLVRRWGAEYGMPYTAAVPIVMVITILLFEYLITIFAPLLERWLFSRNDPNEMNVLRNLEDRLLTKTDFNQFIESILAAVCDRLQASSAFVAELNQNHLEMILQVGKNPWLEDNHFSGQMLEIITQTGNNQFIYSWDGYFLITLRSNEADKGPLGELIGILGVSKNSQSELDEEEILALETLSHRIVAALIDKSIQQEIFTSLQALEPQVELIQRLRAASRYDGSVVFSSDAEIPPGNLEQWVKEALSHYWGGPKLTESPLMNLRVVQDALVEYDGNSANALRAILRQAIDQVKPVGDRRFTGEWILYNILEMKFLEGKKVKEIAMRLALSEADLYRKQKVAIEAVAQAIREMEDQALESTV